MIIAHRLSGMGWLLENRMTLDDLFDLEPRGIRHFRLMEDTRLQFNILNVSFLYEVFLWVDFPVESN